LEEEEEEIVRDGVEILPKLTENFFGILISTRLL
jgi:hypothetical protein